MNRKILTGVLVAGLIVLGVVAALSTRQPVTYNGTYLAPPMPAAPFALHSGAGEVSLADLEGRAVILFFGYTSCPDVCPTTLLRLANALEQLGEGREDVQVVFVSVDPERDTPERADRYAKAVDPSFIGATGTPEQIADVAAQYGIYYAKAPGSEATGYLVDHTATMTVLDREGRVALLLSHDLNAEQIAEDLRHLLRG